MRIKRSSIAAGLTVGVLAGGAGGAIAATRPASTTARAYSTTMPSTKGGWGGYGYGWGGCATGWQAPASGSGWDGGATGWRDPATGSGWGAWSSNPNIGDIDWPSLARSGRRAAQTYLGLSASQLRSRLQSGHTLAEIASRQGRSDTGLKSAIQVAVTDTVNADSGLSASQKSSIIAHLRSFVDAVVTGTWHGEPGGPTTSGGW